MDISRGLIETLKKTAALLRGHEIPYCLAGGLAVSMLARPRATEDVDFIVLMEEDGRGHLEKILREALRVIAVGEVMHFPSASIWRVVVEDGQGVPEGFVVLDFILADRDEYRQAVARALKVEVDGVEVAVAAPEELVAVKRLAGRPIDLMDIEALKDAMSAITK